MIIDYIIGYSILPVNLFPYIGQAGYSEPWSHFQNVLKLAQLCRKKKKNVSQFLLRCGEISIDLLENIGRAGLSDCLVSSVGGVFDFVLVCVTNHNFYFCISHQIETASGKRWLGNENWCKGIVVVCCHLLINTGNGVCPKVVCPTVEKKDCK